MPHIILYNKQGRGEWLQISDQTINPDGYLETFSINWKDGVQHYYLYQTNPASFLSTTSLIVGYSTTIRSCQGLLQAIAKLAGKGGRAAGAAGAAIGTGKDLYDLLKSRNHPTEGYYNSEGDFWIKGKIHKDDPDNYAPDGPPRR